MSTIAGEILIGRPPTEVFDLVADERNRYDPRIEHAELLTDGPLGVGTRFRSVSSSRGRTTEMVVELTAYERPRHLASTTHVASMDIHSDLFFEPRGAGGTRMRWRSDLEPHGLLRVLTPVLGLVGRRQTRRIWEGLRQRLEGDAPAAP